MDSNFAGVSGPGSSVIASYLYVGYNPMQDLVYEDISKIAVSVVFVFFYMWFSTGSFFITCCGLFQIFTSFAGANLVYRFMWPSADGFGYEYVGDSASEI